MREGRRTAFQSGLLPSHSLSVSFCATLFYFSKVPCSARPASRRWTATRTLSLTREKCIRIFPSFYVSFCMKLCFTSRLLLRRYYTQRRVLNTLMGEKCGCIFLGSRTVSLSRSSGETLVVRSTKSFERNARGENRFEKQFFSPRAPLFP